ncbi:MAG: cytochrome c peroxidase [Thermoanaerobaculaceae bacterium]|nr:cytochrome c peroxidase [Thermoanaerobaculaceae bacterium]
MRVRLVVAVVAMTALVVWSVLAAPAATPDPRAQALAAFKPLPAVAASPANPITPEKVALGRLLYFEPRVSADGTVSCARCHQPTLYGTDGLAKPIGVHGRENPRNAPTVLNAALQFVEHWRGDRTSVEDQATQALVGPPSFGNANDREAMARLAAIPEYTRWFARAFPGEADPVTARNWGRAIGAYERTLLTPSPFDAYLGGDEAALSSEAKAGLAAFMQVGCADCHDGVGVGGREFEKFGVAEEYWKATKSAAIDKGRFDVTNRSADLYVFKVPSLRNVAMTPPYFHDGSVATLPEAVRVMARVQLGKALTEAQVTQIVAFLDSLTGTLPADFVTLPVLPAGAFQPAAAP